MARGHLQRKKCPLLGLRFDLPKASIAEPFSVGIGHESGTENRYFKQNIWDAVVVVSVLSFCSDDLSSNPTEVYNFCV